MYIVVFKKPESSFTLPLSKVGLGGLNCMCGLCYKVQNCNIYLSFSKFGLELFFFFTSAPNSISNIAILAVLCESNMLCFHCVSFSNLAIPFAGVSVDAAGYGSLT